MAFSDMERSLNMPSHIIEVTQCNSLIQLALAEFLSDNVLGSPAGVVQIRRC